jgi:hypothetical protein
MSNPAEIATIVIDGHEIRDWETVWVHIAERGALRAFRFSVSEFDATHGAFQIRPGMLCEVSILPGLSSSAARSSNGRSFTTRSGTG